VIHHSFTAVFIAVFIGTALIVASLVLHSARPERVVNQPSAEMVKATGKCASCHKQETSAVVHEFRMSEHAKPRPSAGALPVDQAVALTFPMMGRQANFGAATPPPEAEAREWAGC